MLKAAKFEKKMSTFQFCEKTLDFQFSDNESSKVDHELHSSHTTQKNESILYEIVYS